MSGYNLIHDLIKFPFIDKLIMSICKISILKANTHHIGDASYVRTWNLMNSDRWNERYLLVLVDLKQTGLAL